MPEGPKDIWGKGNFYRLRDLRPKTGGLLSIPYCREANCEVGKLLTYFLWEEKMRRETVATLIGILLVLSFWFGIAESAPPDNFTAKMVMGDMTMPMARMGGNTRTENPMLPGIVTLTLSDEKKTVQMSTANKAYTEAPLQDRSPSLMDPNVVVEKKKIGAEKIDGHPCIKYDTVFYRKDKPAEKFKAVIWEAEDLGGFAIRQEMAMPEAAKGPKGAKMVVEFKEIKLGAAKASLFEVPKDFKKVGSMMELMGGMDSMMEQMKKMMPPKGKE